MIVLFLILYGIMARTLKIHRDGVNEKYLSKENTQVIKGIFVIIVFFSHVRTYASYVSVSDQFVISILSYLGQLMVAMFLFCSGYGVYESIKSKGMIYVNQFPKNRIGKTFFDFFLAICLFLILDIIIRQKLTMRTILLSFIGWESVGNSSWYMFAIFTLYIITYISFKIFRDKKFWGIICVSILSLVYVYVMSKIKENWWSDTYLCFVFGMWYSYFAQWINGILNKCKSYHYYMFLVVVMISYIFVAQYRYRRIMAFNLAAIMFCLLIVVIMMKISFESKVLSWFGKNLFWIYILQRIPMMFFKYIGLNNSHKYIYLYVCAIATILLTIGISRFADIVKQKVWN